MSDANRELRKRRRLQDQRAARRPGAPLLFLHGGRGAGVWLPFFKALSEHFDVIVPEHPGFGRSDTPDWLDNVGDLANFYLEFIDKLGLRDVNLVGTSLGGWIAADIAVRNCAPLANAHAGRRPPASTSRACRKGDLFMWSPEQFVRNLFTIRSWPKPRSSRRRTTDERKRPR